MNNLTEIFCNLNYHWHKRLSEYKSFEIEAYSGLIGFANKLHISIWNRAVSLNIAILYALLHFELRIEWKTARAGVSLWFGLMGFDVGLTSTTQGIGITKTTDGKYMKKIMNNILKL